MKIKVNFFEKKLEFLENGPEKIGNSQFCGVQNSGVLGFFLAPIVWNEIFNPGTVGFYVIICRLQKSAYQKNPGFFHKNFSTHKTWIDINVTLATKCSKLWKIIKKFCFWCKYVCVGGKV